MKLKNNVFSTYPTIQNELLDYKSSRLTTNVKVKSETDLLIVSIDIFVNNQQINNLIKDAKASFYLHCECPTTSFRKIYHTSANNIVVNIPAEKIRNSLEVNLFICLDQDILDFRDVDFSSDYDNLSFSLKKGQIIGKDFTKVVIINKLDSDFRTWPSVIKISSIDSGNPMSVDCSGEYISIRLLKSVFDKYITYSSSKGVSNIIIRLVLFPAIISVLDELRTNGIDSYEEKKWFYVMKKQLLNPEINIDIEDIDNVNKSTFEIATLIFKNSLEKSFEDIKKIMDGDVEEITL